MQNALNKYGVKFGSAQRSARLTKSDEDLTQAKFLTRSFNRLRTKLSPNIRIVPAVQAVLIQLASLITVGIVTWVSSFLTSTYLHTGLTVSVFTLVFLQALFAVAFSYITSMASWWRWIHFCFPLAAWVMLQWHIPNSIYLVGFIVSLSLFWTTFRTQVPFFPSRPNVWRKVAKIIPQNTPVRLIDIGSGLGDMSMYMAKIRPDSEIEGIEIAPLPWVVSYVRARLNRSSAKFILGNYQALDFANYDVIFAYLSPAAMGKLWEKASQEMHSGSLLISLEFEIPEVMESMRITGDKNTPTVYVWKIP